jgi:hypothetical protein
MLNEVEFSVLNDTRYLQLRFRCNLFRNSLQLHTEYQLIITPHELEDVPLMTKRLDERISAAFDEVFYG